MHKYFIAIAAVSGFLAVALGAFGAHGLKPHLSPDELQWFETANRYHFYHTLAIFGTALLLMKMQSRWLKYSGIAFVAGILVFSGSLYVMAVTGLKMLGAVTPIGGLAFLAGWAMLLAGSLDKSGKIQY